MAFVRRNIFPDGKRGEHTQLAWHLARHSLAFPWIWHIQRSLGNLSFQMCPNFLRSSQTSVYPIFSRSFDADFHSDFYKRKDSLKKKKKEKKVG